MFVCLFVAWFDFGVCFESPVVRHATPHFFRAARRPSAFFRKSYLPLHTKPTIPRRLGPRPMLGEHHCAQKRATCSLHVGQHWPGVWACGTRAAPPGTLREREANRKSCAEKSRSERPSAQLRVGHPRHHRVLRAVRRGRARAAATGGLLATRCNTPDVVTGQPAQVARPDADHLAQDASEQLGHPAARSRDAPAILGGGAPEKRPSPSADVG